MSNKTIVRIIVSIFIITIIGIGIKISIANAEEHPHAGLHVNATLHQLALEPRGQAWLNAVLHGNDMRESAVHDDHVVHLDVQNPMSAHDA